tara:strand:+ start:63 stop:614 length:552 start_codon:yes stop_codon:yes gene_type:complete
MKTRLIALGEQLDEILFSDKKTNSHPVRRQILGAPTSAAISAPKGEKSDAFMEAYGQALKESKLSRGLIGAGLLGGAAYVQGKRADAAYLRSLGPKPVNRLAKKEQKRGRKAGSKILGRRDIRGRRASRQGGRPLFSPRLRGAAGAILGGAIGGAYNTQRTHGGKEHAKIARKWEERGQRKRG